MRHWLEVNDGAFAYPGESMLFSQVNFTMDPGEITAVAGPNGAGKTTLLHCLLGFQSWKKGQCFLAGEETGHIPPEIFWQQVAYVPQRSGLTGGYEGLEMILLGRGSHLGFFQKPGRKDLEIAKRIMKELGIWELRNRPCRELSGGELQLVLLGRALAGEPKLLVLDEPESGLDFGNQQMVLRELARLKEQGMMILFNTHYPEHALSLADHVLLLTPGGKAKYGTGEEMITEENMAEAFGVFTKIITVPTPAGEKKQIVPYGMQSKKGRNEEDEEK